ncbi:uncharacterized protein LOC120897660 [Anopheles arabiensis]|uniref:uncharacterized protein LOC120897660 n=1 Tax=Anopheles arabiensis TaxID=7173 RepID=UPI001AACB1B0|nr:uncharacterized protein LOC120897660 [Anopheles arabiensis]
MCRTKEASETKMCFVNHAIQHISDDENDDDEPNVQIEKSGETSEPSTVDESFRTCDEEEAMDDRSDEREEAESSSRRSDRERKPPGWHENYKVDYVGFALSATTFVNDLPRSLE